jgi:antitoxin CptB
MAMHDQVVQDKSIGSALNPSRLSRLKWRCRRGLLENDLLLERFLARHGFGLAEPQVAALERLMELPDNDLLDLLLARSEPTGGLDHPDILQLLTMMRERS